MRTAREKLAAEAQPEAEAGDASQVRPARRPQGSRAAPPAPPGRTRLTIESIVAVDPPREFRLHPRDRFVAVYATTSCESSMPTEGAMSRSRRPPALPFRAGRPTAAASRSSPAAEAGRRSGWWTRRCRGGAARPVTRSRRSRRR